jgi:thioredoxin 1
MAIPSITKADFKKEVLDAEKVVLVFFWASWCAPAKNMFPMLEK